jgi:hypothetical protein
MLRIRIRLDLLDPHHFGKPDPDPHQSEAGFGSWCASKATWDPKLDKSKNSGAVQVQNGAMEDRERSHLRRTYSYNMEPWRTCIPYSSDRDSHHFDKKQDPDSDSASKF